MRLAYLDCFAGISGDMFVASLSDAGVPRPVFDEATAALKLGATLRFERVDRSGITATKLSVLEGDRLADAPHEPEQQGRKEPNSWQPRTQHQHGIGHSHANPVAAHEELFLEEPEGHEHQHGRSLSDIRQLLHDSTLSSKVKAFAVHTFELLGASEAKIHNVPVDDIHFHEVGAVDAIVDIVAAAAGIMHLNVDAWHCSPLNVGGGMVRCAHGVFPVPAPASADLLRGMPTYSARLQKELVTPTGAALVRALAPSFGSQPAMVVSRIGYGAGTRNPPDFPNVLRLSIGEANAATSGMSQENPASMLAAKQNRLPSDSTDVVTVLETALDDATPQLLAFVAEQALARGALDVMLTPVLMKKGRPGTLITVLANPADAGRFEKLLLRETTTLGVRIRQDRRVCLDRAYTPVETPYGSIRVKTGMLDGETVNANPEFEDCRRAAEAHGVPWKHVQAAAVAAFQNLTRDEDSR